MHHGVPCTFRVVSRSSAVIALLFQIIDSLILYRIKTYKAGLQSVLKILNKLNFRILFLTANVTKCF